MSEKSLISTHNSATGNKGYGLLSKLLTPFAKCQNKTLTEQYEAGCRYFDIRVSKDSRGYITAHGPWRGGTLHDVLTEIRKACDDGNEPAYLSVTWEGGVSDWSESKVKYFVEIVQNFVNCLNDAERKYLILTQIGAKKPYGTILWVNYEIDRPVVVQRFYPLYWFNWRVLFPVPRFWAWRYGKVEFNDKHYTQVDFL